jgi:hypothetical protein
MTMGFKEWALLCQALGDGKQSIILRKGGIAEGRAGFRFEHPDFLLFPTAFHEQVQKLKVPANTPLPALDETRHSLRWAATVEWTKELSDWNQIQSLAPHHLWQENVIRERFEYDGKESISLAFLRVFELSIAHEFPHESKYGGCRSWVKIPDLPEAIRRTPVLADDLHQSREKALIDLLR